MRDVVAGIVALALLLVALSLATTLRRYRQSRQRARDSARALGRTIIAELPTADGLLLFSEDQARFYYGDRVIDKDRITAVRVLLNGAPIAAVISDRHVRETALRSSTEPERAEGALATPRREAARTEILDTRPEGIARDRWDVAIESVTSTVVVECGAIRERVSQELARGVFDAVRRETERRNTSA